MNEEENLPDRRKHGYAELEKKIDEGMDDLKITLAWVIRRALVAGGIIGLACTVALFGFGFVLKRQGKTSDEIQQQRFDSLVQNCTQQNERHDRTIAKAKGLPPDAKHIVVLLVNELQPYVDDCSKAARERVRG